MRSGTFSVVLLVFFNMCEQAFVFAILLIKFKIALFFVHP